MVTIAVVGSAFRSLPAERGTVRLRVQVERPDPGSAMRDALALHDRLAGEAQALVDDGAATRWTAEQLRSEARRDYDPAGQPRGVTHVVTAVMTVRFQDFEALARWSAEAAAIGGVDVDGVEWTLTDGSRREAERELRIEAVHDATARARDYAAAIGADGVALQQLWEPGLRAAQRAGGWTAQALARSERAEAVGLALRPAPIEVEASITADFTTT